MAVTLNASTTTGLVQSADTSGIIELQSNGTTALTVNTNEGVQILNCLGVGNATPSTSGAGITFPATQSASTDANTLDDYEEGTWTPSVGGNATYNNQLGHYTKIGNFVKLRFHLEINTLGTGSATTVTGIPFTPSSNGPVIVGGVVCYISNLASASLYIGVYCQSNNEIYFFSRNSSSTGATTQQPSVIGNGFNAYCELSYQV
jgi:hypothetical protein